MRTLLCSLLVFLVIPVVSAKQPPARQIAIAVLPTRLLTGTSGAIDATVFEEAVLAAVQNVGNFRVIGRSDMDAILGYEKQKELLGCDDVQCLAEIGAAFGADKLVDVALARSKDGKWTLTGKMIHVSGDAPEVQGRLLQTVEGDSSTLVAALPAAMRELAAKSGLKVKSPSEIAFRAPTVTSAPRVDKSSDTAAERELRKINIRAERLLEAALDAEESDDATPEEKAEAWCALAKVENNRYQERAQKACREWTEYVHSGAEAEHQLKQDYATLHGYLSLKRKTLEQKLAVVDAFLSAYGHMGNQIVQQARLARTALLQSIDKGWAKKLCDPAHIGTVGCDPVHVESIGLTLERLGQRILVIQCDPTASCELAGFKRGDQLLKVGNVTLESTRQAAEVFAQARERGLVRVRVSRDSTPLSLWLEVP
jgi:hypothetical protein